MPYDAPLQTEAEVRRDLAAVYRLAALEGWDDLIFTHISARVPGPEHHFLINPFGLRFCEVTASNLVKVGLDGQPVEDSPHPVNPAGFVIHSALHMARDDARCVIHLHTDDGVAVAAQADGLLPLSQHAMMVAGQVAYHDYEGIAFDLDERERLVHDLGDRHLMLLRNHGTLAVGPSCAGAWLAIYFLERACTMQVRAQSTGARLATPNQGVPEKVTDQSRSLFDGSAGAFTWPALLRKLDAESPGYAA
ncbi:class II aldolase/adducin family protein [Phenylobacterium sp.]|uniref:class II aldolase/adducin family protein n=1 Tax=Phenylobacterium sp. TaxID=1871053 RepID=UPI00260134B8|nr:class II aldolase/adducin family protein [Phenylobacterium sp.]MBX3481986.1 class II aldolase/adducin family protein [Phenylobacterium sp.]